MSSSFITMWAVFVGVYLLAPIVVSSRRRQRWYLRFTLRQWHVGHLLNMRTSIVLLSAEGEESLRHTFLSQKLEHFTMTVKPDMIVHNVDRTETKIVAAEEPEPITAPTEKSVVSGEMEAEDRPADIETGIVGINVQKAQDTSNVKDSEEDNKDVGNSLFAEGDEGLLCGLPLPGQTISTTADEEQVKRESRDVANSCAVCLSQFEVDEKLCWSGNPECLHVFHQECITDWFQATGRKHLKKIRLENSDQGRKFLVKEATNFSMACPCCRQVFVVDENEQEEQAGEAQNNSDHQETVEAIGTSESEQP